MLFNSYIFIFAFLPITLFLYFMINKFSKKIAQIWLLLASLVFYAYFNVSYLALIVFSILFNFSINKTFYKIEDKIKRKALLIIAICVNLGVFVYFKYYDFFVSNINVVFNTSFNLKNILLPLGISFFTFQQLSYVIDCYRKQVPDYNFIYYSSFVAFFPQLIAGPIVTHDEVIPQFLDESKKTYNKKNFAKGIMAFSIGLAKKVLIADVFGSVVDLGFTSVSTLSATAAILVVLSYTFQIYFDFSGYCDMATGIGLMFNISLPQNFNSPYKATSTIDFWKRWHITLTRFMRKYLYFPLGGNKKGTFRTYLNVFIVFLISGFWHGAAWTFIIWGAVWGVLNILNRIFIKQINKIPKTINWTVTFIFVCITFLIFRAPNMTSALTCLSKILNGGYINIGYNFSEIFYFDLLKGAMPFIIPVNETISYYISCACMIAYILTTFGIALFAQNTNTIIEKFKPTFINSVAIAFILTLSIVNFSGVSMFLYFNF